MKNNISSYGYHICEVHNFNELLKFRDLLVTNSKLAFQTDNIEIDPQEYINYFHKLETVTSCNEADFNEKRRILISKLNSSESIMHNLFNICKNQIIELLGPDLVIQKNINLTIQKPNDTYPTEIHRDSPPNSPYELGIWIPMNDTFGTSALRIVPLNESIEISKKITKYQNCNQFELDVIANSVTLPVKFGEVLFFSPTLFHYSVSNIESYTRFSINIRVKNIYTPYGLKHPAAFFTPISTSPISIIGFQASQSDSSIEND